MLIASLTKFATIVFVFSILPGIPAVAEPASAFDRIPGAVKLLPGYTYHTILGSVSMFSSWRIGEIVNQKGFVITCDAAIYSDKIVIDKTAESAWWQRRAKLCYWSKEQVINGQRVQIGLLKKGKSLCIYFPDGGGYFSTSPITSAEDTTDTLLMVLTYKP